MSDTASDSASMLAEEEKTLELVHQVLESFQNARGSMIFACGGTVPIPAAKDTTQETLIAIDPAPTCPPLVLRWDPESESVPAATCKLKFPLDHSDSTTVRNIQQLLNEMQPATFGYQGQDILDET